MVHYYSDGYSDYVPSQYRRRRSQTPYLVPPPLRHQETPLQTVPTGPRYPYTAPPFREMPPLAQAYPYCPNPIAPPHPEYRPEGTLPHLSPHTSLYTGNSPIYPFEVPPPRLRDPDHLSQQQLPPFRESDSHATLGPPRPTSRSTLRLHDHHTRSATPPDIRWESQHGISYKWSHELNEFNRTGRPPPDLAHLGSGSRASTSHPSSGQSRTRQPTSYRSRSHSRTSSTIQRNRHTPSTQRGYLTEEEDFEDELSPEMRRALRRWEIRRLVDYNDISSVGGSSGRGSGRGSRR